MKTQNKMKQFLQDLMPYFMKYYHAGVDFDTSMVLAIRDFKDFRSAVNNSNN